MEKKINDIITKYQKLKTDAWDNYRNICRQEQKEISDILDFKGKYFKILDNDKYVYIYVLTQDFTKNPESNNSFIRLTGPGITFYIDEDFEYMYGDFDEEFRYELTIYNIKSDLNHIEEISRKEFIVECTKHFDAARRSFLKLL